MLSTYILFNLSILINITTRALFKGRGLRFFICLLPLLGQLVISFDVGVDLYSGSFFILCVIFSFLLVARTDSTLPLIFLCWIGFLLFSKLSGINLVFSLVSLLLLARLYCAKETSLKLGQELFKIVITTTPLVALVLLTEYARKFNLGDLLILCKNLSLVVIIFASGLIGSFKDEEMLVEDLSKRKAIFMFFIKKLLIPFGLYFQFNKYYLADVNYSKAFIFALTIATTVTYFLEFKRTKPKLKKFLIVAGAHFSISFLVASSLRDPADVLETSVLVAFLSSMLIYLFVLFLLDKANLKVKKIFKLIALAAPLSPLFAMKLFLLQSITFTTNIEKLYQVSLFVLLFLPLLFLFSQSANHEVSYEV